MRRTAPIALAAALLVLGGQACSDDGARPEPTTTVTQERPSTPGEVQQSDVEAAACDTNRTILQTQVGVYAATYGRPPETMQDLVEAGLTDPSDQFEVVDGQVVAKPGGPCA